MHPNVLPDHDSVEHSCAVSITRAQTVGKPIVRLSIPRPLLSLCKTAALAERTNDLAALQPNVSQAFSDTLHTELNSAHADHAIIVLRCDRFGEAVIKQRAGSAGVRRSTVLVQRPAPMDVQRL